MQPAAAPVSETPDSRVALRLRPGGPPLLLPGGLLPQIVSDPAIAPLPGCQTWFPGVLARRGEVVPVFDVAAQWGDAALSGAPRYVLVIESGRAPFAILCADLPDVLPVAVGRVPRPVDPVLPAPERYLPVWRQSGAQALPEFDLLAWLADAAPGVLRR